MELLILLVRRRGALVTRDEIVAALWGPDVFVEVETGIHTAMRKIRQALRDAADEPSFIETVPGKGYRFVAPIEEDPASVPATEPPSAAPPLPEVITSSAPAAMPAPCDADSQPTRSRERRPWLVVALVPLVLAVGLVLAWSGWSHKPAGARGVRIAVLPFENLGASPGTDYLADGLAEDTIVSLGRIDPARISVIGRTTMARYRGTTRTLAQIGDELGADYIVESSMRVERGQVRITSRLLRAADQVQVWTDAFDRTLESTLNVQQELSAAIAGQVLTRLPRAPDDLIARRHSSNAEATDHFLRGRAFFNQRTPEAMRGAAEEYARATALDPNYALAWAGLAMTSNGRAINSDADPAIAAPQARAAATRAVALDPELPEAQHALGHVLFFFDWDWPAAEVAFRRAIARDPNFSLGYQSLGHLLSQMGRGEEALLLMRRARELEPRDPVPHALSSQVLFQAGRSSEALSLANVAITLNPELWFGHMMAAQVRAQLQEWDAALPPLAIAIARSQNSKPVSLRGYVLASAGRHEEARVVLDGLAAAAKERYVPPYAMALVNAGLGRNDEALTWLERALAARDVHLIYLPVDHKWDPLRTDPRFAALLARCNFMRR